MTINWISVKERLPVIDGPYLTYRPSPYNPPRSYANEIYTVKNFDQLHLGWFVNDSNKRITHWAFCEKP